jgi:hypothetical protein
MSPFATAILADTWGGGAIPGNLHKFATVGSGLRKVPVRKKHKWYD